MLDQGRNIKVRSYVDDVIPKLIANRSMLNCNPSPEILFGHDISFSVHFGEKNVKRCQFTHSLVITSFDLVLSSASDMHNLYHSKQTYRKPSTTQRLGTEAIAQ